MQTAIKQRPILFSTPMVQAILEGRKTMTRRIVKGDVPLGNWEESKQKCPYGRIGDELWVRETFVRGCIWDGDGQMPPSKYWYRADNNCPTEWHNEKKDGPGPIPWKPSIFMPKDACRLFLEITDIWVERLQDISEEDAIAEGIESNGITIPIIYRDYLSTGAKYCHTKNNSRYTPLDSFHSLWESINGLESWESNPFVWVVNFIQTDKPE